MADANGDRNMNNIKHTIRDVFCCISPTIKIKGLENKGGISTDKTKLTTDGVLIRAEEGP